MSDSSGASSTSESSSSSQGLPQPVDVPAGTVLVHENETSRKMFVIKKGKARVFKRYLGQKVALAILGEGEIFGELSFFDGEPRSASVEALTPMSVVMIDGGRAQKEIAGLPNWVIPVFRAAFGRLREADQRLTVLQSTNDFQKKAFKHDATAKTVLAELIRFSKTLILIYERTLQGTSPSTADSLVSDLDGVLGQRMISLRMFWRQMIEFDYVDEQVDSKEGRVKVNVPALQNFIEWAAKLHGREKIVFPSHTCLAVARKLVGHLLGEIDNATLSAPDHEVEVALKALDPKSMHDFDRGLDELVQSGVAKINGENVVVNTHQINQFYSCQSIAKAFDLSIAVID
jgi:CRP/FNR family cyclic AMP-dependent transcriptional regulator